MARAAIVGYREFPSGGGRDFIAWLPGRISRLYPDISFCHVDVVEDRNGKSIDKAVSEMLALEPDVLHYANFRDSLTGFGFDREYITLVQRLSRIPILLTTGHDRGEEIAAELMVYFLDVPFRVDEYANRIRELSKKA